MKLKELNARLALPAGTSQEAAIAVLADRRIQAAAERKRSPQPGASIEGEDYPREWLSASERMRAAGEAPTDTITIVQD